MTNQLAGLAGNRFLLHNGQGQKRRSFIMTKAKKSKLPIASAVARSLLVVRKKQRLQRLLAIAAKATDVFEYYDRQIREHDQNDRLKVLTAITLDESRGIINCYGMARIPGDILFRRLNMNCATKGKRTTCQVSYPSILRLQSYKLGYFIKITEMKEFGYFYAAVINIPCNPEEEVIHFPVARFE